MALAIDASTPAFKGTTGPVTAAGSNTFSPPAGSVIFLAVQANGSSASAQSVTSVTDSLAGHLTWSLLVRANGFAAAGACGGTAEWWWASCPSAQVGMTVTANLTKTTGGTSTPVAALLPVVMTGASTTQAGATATASNTTSTASAATNTLTGVVSGSQCIAVGCNNHTQAAVAGAGQTVTINAHVTTGVDATDFYSLYTVAQTSTAVSGSVVCSNTDTEGAWNQCAIEIQAAGAAAGLPDLIMAPAHR